MLFLVDFPQLLYYVQMRNIFVALLSLPSTIKSAAPSADGKGKLLNIPLDSCAML